MDSARFPEIIKQIYSLVSELETMFEGRHFTVNSTGRCNGLVKSFSGCFVV